MGDVPGRWPANVILSPEMAVVLDEQSGNRDGRPSRAVLNGETSGSGARTNALSFAGSKATTGYADQGGASRFFLNAGYEPRELEWILANGLVPCGGTVYHGP